MRMTFTGQRGHVALAISDRATEPPELPVLKRRLKLGGWQLLGIGVLVLIPVLAMFKVFGAGQASITGQAGAIRIDVDYPPRIRHGSTEMVTALVTNLGASAMDTMTVVFDSSYVGRVLEPRFLPSASRAFEVDLIGVAPRETRKVQLGFYAEDYGRHAGSVSARHAGDTARAAIATFVFP